MEDDEQEDLERLRDWIGRLRTFTSSLDDIEETEPIDFCEKAGEAWQTIAFAEPPPPATPAMLVILGTLQAFANVMTAATVDYYNTPDVRDRMTRDAAQQSLKEALDTARRDGERWLAAGPPSAEEIKQRNNAALASLQAAKEAADKIQAKEEANEAEAAADPYGAILLHHDPNRDPSLMFEKVCSLTEDEDKRYRDAYERLRRMVDSELLRHISDESDRLCDVLIGVLRELQSQQVSLDNQDAMDERRRKIRSALISFTSALQIHEYQTIRASRQARDTSPAEAVKELFTELKRTSFEFRWLEALRDALQHGDINAFKWEFSVSVRAEPEVRVNMDRAFMLEFTKETRNRPWLKRRELEARDSDPSVLDMIKAIQPLMGPLQEKLDAILYPNAAEDAATVRELIGRFPGTQGLHALQNGPGFTRRNPWPPIDPLAPRVILFALNYGAAP
jgi:hypothetical protein